MPHSHKLTPAEIKYFKSGYGGFDRIDGTGTGSSNQIDGPFLFVVCQDGNVSFDGAGTTMRHGDPPDGADTFNKGRKVLGPFESVQLTAGVVYAYRSHFEEEDNLDYDYSPNTPGSNER